MAGTAWHTAAVQSEDRPIGEAIREARKRRGLTQQQVADEIGVDNSAVRAWESGANAPRGDNLRAVAALLGIEDALRVAGPPMTAAQIEQALREAPVDRVLARAMEFSPSAAAIDWVVTGVDVAELVGRAMRTSSEQVVEQVLRMADRRDVIGWALRTADAAEFAAEASRRLARSHGATGERLLTDADVVGVPLPSHRNQQDDGR